MDSPELQNVPVSAQPEKPVTKSRWAVTVLIIAVLAFTIGYQTGKKGFIYQPKEFKVINQNEAPQTVDYSLLWDAIDKLNQNYINRPLNPQNVLYGAIKGVAASTGDPYTDFFSPKDLDTFQTGLSGQFYGIGAEVGKKDGNIVIVAPLDGTPAQKAGLKANDIIYKVDGQLTTDWSVEQAVDKIRGPAGTPVTLTIVRQGASQPKDIKITRAQIQVKSVKWTYQDIQQNGQHKKIAVVTISQFGDDTEPLFNDAVNDIMKNSVDGIVLDLRNNPGGYLQTAVDIASNWVKSGQTVVTEAKSDTDKQDYKANGNTRLAGISTVVLINGGSASAAEILSGALHDYHVAPLVGEKSFGKGSVQQLVQLKDGSALKITVAKWITPGGQNLNGNGLDPDVKVTLSDQDIASGKDPQMDAAMQQFWKK